MAGTTSVLFLLLFSGFASFGSRGVNTASTQTTFGSLIYAGTTSLAESSHVSSGSLSSNGYRVPPSRPVSLSSSESNLQVPETTPSNIIFNSPASVSRSFVGIDVLDSARVNDNFSYTPPDQGLCANGQYVMEAVNTALDVYTYSGIAVTQTVGLNQFFRLRV